MPPHLLRAEIQRYVSACEGLFFAFNSSSSFTTDELGVLNYYLAEVSKRVGDKASTTVNTNYTETASHNGV